MSCYIFTYPALQFWNIFPRPGLEELLLIRHFNHRYIAWTGLLITFCLVIIIWFPISLMRWIMRGGGKVEVRLEQIERDWYVRFD